MLPDRDARLEFSRPFWEALSKAERHALLQLPLDALAARAAASDFGAHTAAARLRHTCARGARSVASAARRRPAAAKRAGCSRNRLVH